MLPSPDTPSQPASALFARLLFTLRMLVDAEVRIRELGPQAAHLKFGDGDVMIIVCPEHERQLEAALEPALRLAEHRAVEFVLVGGPHTIRAAIKPLLPARLARRILYYHLTTNGEVWRWAARSTPFGRALEQWGRRLPSLSESQWLAFVERATADMQEAQREALAFETFARPLRAKRPRATWALLALIGFVFLFQMALGGSDPLLLVRMGSLRPQRVMDGEWWRLISCTFLHGGMSHIFFNGYVLYALGSGLERLIGTSRFIVLYGVSGLAGSLLSLQFVQTQSVGASGAIWGLLGAYSILVLRSPSPMPLSLRRQSRRAVWMTLGINILVSFLPFVDAAAHFGGGIAGATLMLLPAYRRGLPEFDGDQLRHGATPTEPPMKLAAALLTAAYLMGLALGLTHDQPWRPSADGKSRTGQVQVQRLSSQPAAGAGVIEIIDKHSARASQ